MNKLETTIYNLVKKHPGVKKTVKSLYQGTFDLLPKKTEYFSGDYDYREGFFFGFHDVSPFSKDETKCLANKVPFEGRMPQKGEPMEIGYFNMNNGKFGQFHKLTETYAWNYHKGCRLQWLNNTTIIYNTTEGPNLVAIVYDMVTGAGKTIPYPIDAIYDDGSKQLATNFSYERLNRCMPGYGYAVGDGDREEDAPADTGLFLIDLRNGKRELLVSLKELATTIGSAYSTGYTHFVTHTEFSKDGNYIAFLYRAAPVGQEGKDMHKTWILVYDIINKEIIQLPTQESGSHYVWNNKNEIVASCVIDGKSCHALFEVTNLQNVRVIAGDVLNSDGHQSFITDDVFITDTYPDRRRMTRLYKVNIKDMSVKIVADVYSPKEFQTTDVYCHIACDLHPRVSPSGNFVIFDSPRTGKRSLYIMKLT